MTRARRAMAVAVALALATALGSCSDDSPSGSPTTQAQSSTTAPEASTTTTTSAGGLASGPSAGCDAETPHAPGTTGERIESGGEERSYQLIVPEGYDGTEPLPLVFALHSLTIDYRIVPGMAGFADMAPTYDFIGVSPSGLLNSGGLPYWNAAPVEDNADLDFLGELLDHLEETLCIDRGMVFSLGMSNGAQTSSLLACRMGDRIAAIGPIAGVELNEPCDSRPVPIMAFHGALDPIVPYEGGGLNSVKIADSNLYKGDLPEGVSTPTGVDESMRRWAEHNGCEAEFSDEQVSPEVIERTWLDCEAPTVLYIVENGGHAWPGKPMPGFEASFGHGTSDIDATELLFAFFFEQAG